MLKKCEKCQKELLRIEGSIAEHLSRYADIQASELTYDTAIFLEDLASKIRFCSNKELDGRRHIGIF